jgi:hypothetical protein
VRDATKVTRDSSPKACFFLALHFSLGGCAWQHSKRGSRFVQQYFLTDHTARANRSPPTATKPSTTTSSSNHERRTTTATKVRNQLRSALQLGAERGREPDRRPRVGQGRSCGPCSICTPSFLPWGLCSEHSHLRQASFTSSSHMPLPPFLPHPFLFLPSKITVC